MAKTQTACFETGGDGPVILVVDDEPIVRGVLARGLARGGYRVLVAEDADTALRLAQGSAHRIDVLVTDLAMADMCGATLARAVRHASPKTRVVYVTGNADALRRRREALGAPCLQKPFLADELNAVVGRVLAAE